MRLLQFDLDTAPLLVERRFEAEGVQDGGGDDVQQVVCEVSSWAHSVVVPPMRSAPALKVPLQQAYVGKLTFVRNRMRMQTGRVLLCLFSRRR